jgi:hypothetical protein
MLVAAIITLIAGIVVVAAAGISYFLTMGLESNTATTTTSIADAEKKIADNRSVTDELAAYTRRANQLQTLFTAQKNWPVVLGFIEQRLYKSMVASSLQLKSTGEVVLSGAVPTYDDYARFYTSLVSEAGQQYFSLVKPGQVTRQTDTAGKVVGGVQFTFTLTLQPAVLTAQTADSLAQ